MKILLTGSLGNITKPTAEQLISAGNDVTVISSNPETGSRITDMGATAAIGSVSDEDFLVRAFKDAEAVYLMIPASFTEEDLYAYQIKVADNYVSAITKSGIKKVVLLSSIGAHLRKGAGPIDGLGYMEEQLEKLTDVTVKILRPSYFFYNLYSMSGLLKNAGIMGSNFGGTTAKFPLTHTRDISKRVVEALKNPETKGHSIEYIVSDERTTSEIAAVLGSSVGKPETPWILFSDEDARNGMLQAGLSENMASNYVQMGKAFREGKAQEHYLEQKNHEFGDVKLEEFAEEFAAAYGKS